MTTTWHHWTAGLILTAGVVILSTCGAEAETARPAFAYRPAETHCHQTLELLLERELREKILQESWLGAFGELTVRWSNGTVQELTVGPSGDQFCVLASRFVSSLVTQ